MIQNTVFNTMLNSPVRAFAGRVEIYDGSTLALMCGCHDSLISFSVERVGENSKFFGFGVCQKINVKLRDINRAINITTANTIEVVFGSGSDYIYAFPNFYVTEVHRDENTNELSITAYDALYKATKLQAKDFSEIPYPASIEEYTVACANLLGLPLTIIGAGDSFKTLYYTPANLDGTETIRDVLNAIAEATQTIYYIDKDWRLTFKRLDKSGAAVMDITKEHYFTLDSGDNRRLAKITHTTELGDNIGAALDVSGTTQYIRDNPFWNLREDTPQLVENALAAIGGLTINQFECTWRGNFLTEIGDKIGLITKDNKTMYSYIIDDVISFDGSLTQETRWNYENNEEETEDNPASLGDVIKKTYARVDKANKQIELLASETAANYESIAALQMDTESITASVRQVIEENSASIDGINDNIATLNKKVEAAITTDNVTIAIQSELENGVNKITTKTGFTFDDVGLTIDKSGTEMKTQITEDGMTVFRDNTAMLVANNVGVEATNLYAKTYLIIGENSRFEDYGTDRSACFWIGG